MKIYLHFYGVNRPKFIMDEYFVSFYGWLYGTILWLLLVFKVIEGEWKVSPDSKYENRSQSRNMQYQKDVRLDTWTLPFYYCDSGRYFYSCEWLIEIGNCLEYTKFNVLVTRKRTRTPVVLERRLLPAGYDTLNVMTKSYFKFYLVLIFSFEISYDVPDCVCA